MDGDEEKKIVKSWLKQLQSWFSQNQDIVEPRVAFHPLSESQQSQLRETISTLTASPIHYDVIEETVTSAVRQWQEGDRAFNSLVILSEPVEPIDDVLTDVMKGVSQDCNLLLQSLPLAATPTTHPEVQVQQFLDALDSESQSLLSIPSLSSCFLRCIGGLDGIKRLREAVFAHPQHFWAIGCNTWAWQYLKKTDSIQADFGQTFALSPLAGDELQQWLKPAIDRVSIEAEPEEETAYFDRLANLSEGLSQIAGQLWFNSLGCDGQEDSSSVCRSKIELPKLPSLQMGDRYLVYSLLLHEKMALPQLALSLGEPEGTIRPTILQLQQKGLVGRQQDFFFVNPIHYPKLLVDLAQNSFPVEL